MLKNYSRRIGIAIFRFFIGIGLHIGMAKIGLLLATIENSTSPIWPASGVAVAMLVFWGTPMAIPVCLASIFLNYSHSTLIVPSILMAMGTTFEVIWAQRILSKLLERKKEFKEHHEIVAYIAAALIPTLISASISTCSLWAFHLIPDKASMQTWITWWIGDSLGILVTTPVLLTLIEKDWRSRWLKLCSLRHLMLLISLGLTAFAIFFTQYGPYLPFLIYPLLMVAGYLGSLETKLFTLLTSVVAIIATSKGYGPFRLGSLNDDFIYLQLYLGSIALSGISINGLRRQGSMKFPSLGLGLVWIATAAVFLFSTITESKQSEQRFNRLSYEAIELVHNRILAFENTLRGGAGLIAATQKVSKAEWLTYANTSKIIDAYSGVESIGIITPVAIKNTTSFLKNLQAIHKRKISIKDVPEGGDNASLVSTNQTRYIITHLAPERTDAIGLDVGSEHKRRLAAELARDTGEPVFTSRLSLFPRATHRQGFLLFVPFYKKNRSLNTTLQRRLALEGWVFAPFIANDFFNGIFGAPNEEIYTSVFFGDKASPENLAYTSEKEPVFQYEKTFTVEIAHQKITFAFVKSPFFNTNHDIRGSWILLFGSLIAILAAGLISTLQSLNRRAEIIALEKTALLAASENRYRLLSEDLEARVNIRTQELKEANISLQQKEARFRQMADSMPQIVWTVNKKGEPNYFNQQWWKYTGADPQSSDLNRPLNVIHPDDHFRVVECWAKSLKTGKLFEVEYRLRRNDGTYRWHLGRVITMFDEGGNLINGYGTATDIDDKKKSEEALLHMAAIVEYSEDAIIGEDLEGRITDWNLSAERMYQYKAIDVLSQSSTVLFPKDKIDEETMIIEHIKNGKIIRHFETEQLKADGSVFPISISVSPIRNASGQITGISKIVRDITDEKRITSALRASEKQLSIVTDIIPGMIFYISKERRFLYVNKMCKKFLGTDQHQLVGKTLESVLDPEHFKKISPYIDTVLAGKEASFSDDFSKSQNASLYLSVKYTPDFDEHGKVQGFLALVLDVSSQKIAEEERYAASVREHAANEASRLKSEFLANMSHEVRTPISGVIGMARLLLETPLSAEQKEFATAISHSGDLLLNVVNDILDFSRVEAGKITLENISFNLNNTLTHIKRSFAQLAENKDIEFYVLGLEKLQGVNLLGDPNRFHQIVANLIANAIKFTNEGSVLVNISGEEIFRESNRFMHLKMEISDTGIGMSKDQLSRLFNPFTQGDGSTSRKYGGSGLGLSISKRLLALMNGSIEVKSQLGIGSTFVISLSLPLSEIQPIEKNEAIDSLQSDLKNLNILIAEDNLINQRIIQKIVSDLGARSHLVKNGIEVLKELESSSYDIILMDCQMPEMDGFQTTQNIRKHANPLIASIPIIATTANAMSDDRQRCLDNGMNDYVSKPIKPVVLAQILKKWSKADTQKKSNYPRKKRTDSKQNLSTFNSNILQELFDYRGNQRNADILAKLMSSFLDNLDHDLEAISKSIECNDQKDVNLKAHTMKSTTAAMGAEKMSSYFLELEKITLKEADPDQMKSIFNWIETEKSSLISQLKSFLKFDLRTSTSEMNQRITMRE